MYRSHPYLKLETHRLDLPYTEKKRRIRVLLPKNYYLSQKNYPVIYMHDGQNIFYNKESYSGSSWQLIQTIKKYTQLPEMIVVAIDNGGADRIDEYTPWQISSSPYPHDLGLGGLGDSYGSFVINLVKPFIDSHYRTKPQKEYTAMCGSSLGGTITSYMGIRYKDKIGHLGIFSLANWIVKKEFNNYIEGMDLDPCQRVFIQVGTQEGDSTDEGLVSGNIKQIYIDTSLAYYKFLIKKGISIDNVEIDIVADAKHEETAWAESLPKCLYFLSKNW